MRPSIPLSILAVTLLGVAAPARADLGVATTAQLPPHDRGCALIGLKIGADLPQAFSPLSTSYFLEAEAGYLLPFLKRSLGVFASLAYAAPETGGSGSDPRLPGGGYDYHVVQQQLTLGLTVVGKIPLGRVVPYLGLGPRFFFVKTTSFGQATGTGQAVPIQATTETSSEFGLGAPVGLEVIVGPGRVFGEAQVLWARTGQHSTGPGSLGAITLGAGYRLVL